MPTYFSQSEHFTGTLEMEALLQRTKGKTGEGGINAINSSKKLKRKGRTNAFIIRRYRVESRLVMFVFNEEKDLKMLIDNKKLSNRQGR